MYLMLLFSLITWSVYAGGYQVRLQGQKQTGIGLIGSPFNLGASSIFYNPGALSMMKSKYSFSIGVNTIFAKALYMQTASDNYARTDNKTGTPFYAYGAGKITDKITIGLGIYTPFGSSSTWDDNWSGKYLIRNISLKSFFIQPTVSYKVNDKLGIGAGFTYVIGNVKLNKAVAYNNASSELEGSGSNIGFNIGIYYKPCEKLSIGIDYRSKVNMKVENGDANFYGIPTALSSVIPSKNKFDAELPLPANLDFGISYQVTEKLLLAAEINYVAWGTYDSLIFKFKENGEALDSHNPRKYKDSWIMRIGGEYALSEKLILRAGGYYDPSPCNDNYFNPETVSLNTVAFTLGLSYMPTDKISIDLSYLQLHGLKGEKSYEPANFSGDYKTQTCIPGIGISYNF